MSSIDDPIEAIKKQYPDTPENKGAEIALDVVAGFSPLAGIASSLRRHFVRDRMLERLNVLFEALHAEVKLQGKRLEDLETRVQSASFAENVAVAVSYTLQTTNIQKIRGFGQILAADLVDHDPDDNAAALIRDLAELRTADVEALDILFENQHDLIYILRNENRLDPNPFTRRNAQVLREVDRRGIPQDEYYSRCSRLSGFGLALEVPRVDTQMALGEQCYRLTIRGERLVSILRHYTKR